MGKILIRLSLLTLCLSVFVSSFASQPASVVAAQNLAKRIIPAQCEDFRFVEIPKDHGKDCFTIESKNNLIVIGGNNPVSMAMALNHYLQKYCLVSISWYDGIPVTMPDSLPIVTLPEKVVAKVDKRFFLNYCTYGYTMVFWQWQQWQHFIDWMALNGINMPLAITGQEAVWYNVWKNLGMTDSEIRDYFTGPAYLPWHRMSNIDSWNGPLPKEWLDNQVLLQKQILSRERELSMTPVLPAFAGHVPGQLAHIFPKADIKMLTDWAGFEHKYACHFLNPEDPLFSAIQKMYLNEQTELFGTDHVYGTDPFNEVDPPSWEPAYLHKVAKNIYKSLTAVDKDAIWMQMTWVFYYQSKDWTNPRIEAMLSAVPKDKFILLDYHCENTEIWKRTNKFFGSDYIWCYLGNFGGNTAIQGDVKESGSRLDFALTHGGTNLIGIGSTLEGLDVMQFPYEYILNKAWTLNSPDSEWVNSLADRHCGYVSQPVRDAWNILFNKVYTVVPNTTGILPNFRPRIDFIDGRIRVAEYDQKELIKAWQLLLQAPTANTDALKLDLIVVGRQILGNYFFRLKQNFDKAYHDKDIEALNLYATQMSEILRDLDALNAFHPYCSLDTWIDMARNMGTTATLKDYYEDNARRLITTWSNSPQLNDYASRTWAGLIQDYYTHRWQAYFDDMIDAVKSSKDFNQHDYDEKMLKYERDWAKSTNSIIVNRGFDILQFSRMLYQKYATMLNQ